MKSAAEVLRILIRRPHAYKFRRDHPKSPIPGIVLLDANGKVLASSRLPARGGVEALLDVLDN
ncbi:MAG: hypothetical protein ACYTGW_12890 [Planctomycetota bacterium]